ncbi:AAA domain-containing protein [Catellatospora coxensis]
MWDSGSQRGYPKTGLAVLDDHLDRLGGARRAADRASRRVVEHTEGLTAAVRAEEETTQWNAAQATLLTHELAIAEQETREYEEQQSEATADRDRYAERLPAKPSLPMRQALERRKQVLPHLADLESQWTELISDLADEQLVDDIQSSLIRATNLVCATTTGIVGRGSQWVKHTDYDTLIVDESSRVTESEFLIGAVKARRWVLVGDEHQLPPHVDQADEFFLHALTALHRVERKAAPSLQQAVEDLAAYWDQQEDSHEFRVNSVIEVAEGLLANDQWALTFRSRFAEAYDRFVTARKPDRDPDLALLTAMLRYLVQSLFQRAVRDCPGGLRQPLLYQRRMIEPLARIVRDPVYGGAYLTPPPKNTECGP